MDILIFRSFVKHASAEQTVDGETPPGYVETKAALQAWMSKRAGVFSSMGRAMGHPLASPGLDLAGLGVLAVPSAQTLANTRASQTERNHAKWELGGLGVLAAHPAWELGHSLLRR